METMVVWKEKMQELYGKYSTIITRVGRFCLAFVIFFSINQNIGFMKRLANPIVAVLLAAICAFLPMVITVAAAMLLILAHMKALSMIALAVTAVVFLIMFCLYFHFTPKQGILVLLVPLTFWLKIPYVLPIACGLVGTPLFILPISFGLIVYYMVTYIKTYSTALTGADAAGMVEQLTAFIQKILQNKEMWIMVVAFALCLALVYAIHKMDVDFAWSIAIIAGAVTNVIVVAVGAIYFNVKISFPMLIVGNLISVGIALVLQFFFFAVDYSRVERLQYEDDEYVYYVKAVPKIILSAPEKRVKTINERQNTEDMSEEEDSPIVVKKTGDNRPSGNRKGRQVKRKLVEQDTDEVLLAKSLQKELQKK